MTKYSDFAALCFLSAEREALKKSVFTGAHDKNVLRAVGVLRRVVLVINDEEEILELINPEIIHTEGEQTGPEGCLSVPGKFGMVTRPNFVRVRAQDRFGDWFEAEGEELTARCFCHELDHLDGILYTEVMERYLTEEELGIEE